MRFIALASKNRNNNKMGKRKRAITLKVLNEVKKDQFLQTKGFIAECLEQECFKVNISVEEVIFLFTSLEATS